MTIIKMMKGKYKNITWCKIHETSTKVSMPSAIHQPKNKLYDLLTTHFFQTLAIWPHVGDFTMFYAYLELAPSLLGVYLGLNMMYQGDHVFYCVLEDIVIFLPRRLDLGFGLYQYFIGEEVELTSI